MNIDTVRLPHLLEVNELNSLSYFLSNTAFVISHKSESMETLLSVLWYLPVNSPIIIVTNCPEQERDALERNLIERLTHHQKVYLIHQKDEGIAQFFKEHGVGHILGEDGKVVNGKGEGMYIGALCAALLDYPQWIIFYDADNFVPSALLEYTLAMSKLFLLASPLSPSHNTDSLTHEQVRDRSHCSGYEESIARVAPGLHNIRICWSSKPEAGTLRQDVKLLGRCTRVISPVFSSLLEAWFGITSYPVYCSNAGEQGMSIQTAKALRFSSGYSVETFQMLDFLFQAVTLRDEPGQALLQQYQAKSPHFHEKRDDEHIKRMIEASLGCFYLFKRFLPNRIQQQLQQIYTDMNLTLVYPKVYPALQDMRIEGKTAFAERYRLWQDTERYPVLIGQEVTCSLS